MVKDTFMVMTGVMTWLWQCMTVLCTAFLMKCYRLYSVLDSIIKVSLLCSDVFYFHREKKAAFVTQGLCVCAHVFVWEWVNGWDHPRRLIISYSLPIKKVESASPSLWKFPTTPSWRIMTKPSNSCWKRSTRGQSSSSPVKKTYGEERYTFWLHPCCSGVLMTLPCWGSLISEQQLLETG